MRRNRSNAGIPEGVTRRALGLLTLLLVLGVAQGCRGYGDSGLGRTTGELTDDFGIHANVKARLVKDKAVKGFALNVDVYRGVVYLFGRVSDDATRQRAIDLAAGVKGVKRVEDRMAIIER